MPTFCGVVLRRVAGQAQEAWAVLPARIGQIGVVPEHERPGRQELVLVPLERLLRQDRRAVAVHDRQAPGGQLGRGGAAVGEPCSTVTPGPRSSRVTTSSFWTCVVGLTGCISLRRAGPPACGRSGRCPARSCAPVLRRDPDAVAGPELPLVGLVQVARRAAEDVVALGQRVMDDARPDVGRDDQLGVTIAELQAVRQVVPGDRFHVRSSSCARTGRRARDSLAAPRVRATGPCRTGPGYDARASCSDI